MKNSNEASDLTGTHDALLVTGPDGVSMPRRFRIMANADRGLADSYGNQDHGGDGKGNHETGATHGRIAEYYAATTDVAQSEGMTVEGLLAARLAALQSKSL